MMANSKRILVIAGSDSSGGAGLEADQKVIAAHGCYAMTATTALTAQNTQSVFDVHHTPSVFVAKQIDACIDDVGVDVVKIGMLASAETVGIVADSLQKNGRNPVIVLDPVMVSTSGAQLLPPAAVSTLTERLLPMTTVLTPNIPEAKLLLKREQDADPKSEADVIQLAQDLCKLGPSYVLVKGGHLKMSGNIGDSEIIVDALCSRDQTHLFEKPRIDSNSTHGTGCSLASAIASHIALGEPIVDAVKKACQYVEAGIKTAISRGKGHGPINHFHSTYTLPFAPGRFLDYLLARADVKQAWKEHTEHQFVDQIAKGTLPPEKFQYYLVQDYLFLVQFARAKALGASKTKTIDDVAAGAAEILHVQKEIQLHITYCEGFGLSRRQIESTPASQACVAYTRYVHDIGNSEDWFALQVAFAPCLIGYGDIARRLYDDPNTVKGKDNKYWTWIENYVAQDYVDAVSVGKEILEKHAVMQSPHRIEQLVEIFITATELETGFWDMGHGGGLKGS